MMIRSIVWLIYEGESTLREGGVVFLNTFSLRELSEPGTLTQESYKIRRFVAAGFFYVLVSSGHSCGQQAGGFGKFRPSAAAGGCLFNGRR